MKTIIIYATKTGVVEECAHTIKDQLDGDSAVFELKKLKNAPDIDIYDRIIIGASIHVGNVQRQIIDFLLKNAEKLKQKEYGLFLCSLTPPDEATHYFEDLFPADIVSSAKALGNLGGALYFEKLNCIEKLIMRLLKKTDSNIEAIDKERLEAFVNEMKH